MSDNRAEGMTKHMCGKICTSPREELNEGELDWLTAVGDGAPWGGHWTVGAGGWGDRERKKEVLGSTPFPVFTKLLLLVS